MKKTLLILAASLFASNAMAQTPVFKLAWSEYPSWSAIDVASSLGQIDGKAGKMGPIEKKYGVDIELKLLDYDACIQAYSNGNVDAVCITTIDALSPSLGRHSVVVLPTSTSYGADALIVPSNVSSIQDLRGQTVYGLSASVSQYVFSGILSANGVKDADASNITFANMDPSQVAVAIQNGDSKVRNGIVWNPFVLDTLKKRKDVKILASSTLTPFEVVDSVVFGADSLKRDKGDAAAKAICEAYYFVASRLNSEDQSVRDETLVLIGEKFSNLPISDMRKVVQQTRFFGTPANGVALFDNMPLYASGEQLAVDGRAINGSTAPILVKDDTVASNTNLQSVMKVVLDRSVSIGIISKVPSVGYSCEIVENVSGYNLYFDSQYMRSLLPSSNKGFSPLNSPPLKKNVK